VLVYHRVASPVEDAYRLSVSGHTFERQLRIARGIGRVVDADALVTRLGAGASTSGLIAVTFDDGYEDNLSTAAGIAHQLEVPLTIFIAVRAVLHGSRFWWDELAGAILGAALPAAPPLVIGGVPLRLATREERQESLDAMHRVLRRAGARDRARLLREILDRLPPLRLIDTGRPMTDEELRRLARLPGVTIGAHTMTHPSLGALPPADQLDEIASSREALETLLGIPIRLLAYPFGKTADVSAPTRDAARAAGFHGAFTTEPDAVRPDTDVLAIPRLTVHEWPDDEFAARLERLMG
jgi:peptidoglycan/xylan/chitin deacetylase (PgdA/CDA1 family)